MTKQSGTKSNVNLSSEIRMYQEILHEAADVIYVINQVTYEILYFHESKKLFPNADDCVGKLCYQVLRGMESPCSFCNFHKESSGENTEVVSQWNGRTYHLRCRETDWNGIPAYIQYLRDVTEEIVTWQEKQRLEQYFQTMVESLPGGVVVVHRRKDGS